MSNKWFPIKKEIKIWIDWKLHKFSAKENRNPCPSKEEWLNRYLYTDEHEIFFCSVSCKLHEWLSILVENQGMWNLDNPIVWTPKLVRDLEDLENKIMRVVDYWIDNILGDFITELTIDTSASYSEA